MCLMPLSTFVTLSRFNDRNEIRIVRDKIAQNPMLNIVATLQQCLVNVGTTLICDRATTLWQHQQRRCDIVVTTSLCQLGNEFFFFARQNCASRGFVLAWIKFYRQVTKDVYIRLDWFYSRHQPREQKMVCQPPEQKLKKPKSGKRIFS